MSDTPERTLEPLSMRSQIEKLETELAITHRALRLELQQQMRCHEEVLRLAERLRKYENGSPMILNSGEKK